MSKKAKKASRKRAAKSRVVKTGTRARKSNGGRTHKAYAVVGAIPEAIGQKTVARKILQEIERQDGKATFESIREAVAPKPKLPTLRFYLGKFQREKIIKSK